MATLADLATELRKIANNVGNDASDVSREVARAIAHDVIDHTPVDSGETVSCWEIGIGAPPVAKRGAFVPGKAGSTAAANRQAAKAACDAALDTPKAPGTSIFISNAGDAIAFLNGGSSQQEPAGFVERGIIVGRLKAAELGGRNG